MNKFQKEQAQRILSLYGKGGSSIERSENDEELDLDFEVQTEELENIGRLEKQVLYLLNKQIRNEFQSSFIYRETSAWLDDSGWIGGSKLFAKYADEELDHAKKIYQYIFEKNCKAITPSDLGNIELLYTSIKDLVTKALEHEMQVTADWNTIASVAKDLNDHDTYAFALIFIKEQTEEEEKFRNILFKINLDMPKYEIDELFEDNLTKSEELDIEKGGEGSRGGKVIGHTKSGKPIYDHFDHEGHKDFTKEDHRDAYIHHDNLANNLYDKRFSLKKEEYNNHLKQSGSHFDKTRSFDVKKSKETDIEKGGEGSRGGKVIGHTKSGKPIYEHKYAKDYKDFNTEEHKEANKIHNDLMYDYEHKLTKLPKGKKSDKEEEELNRKYQNHRRIKESHLYKM